MPIIHHDLPIAAPPDAVFAAVTTPAGLDRWWTLTSSGDPAPGAEYQLGFGPDHQWTARVTSCVPVTEFELELTEAVEDWEGTRVGFRLTPTASGTAVTFHHDGWPEPSAHYRGSCYCWAMYLRILKRNLEHGEEVPYAKRLDA